MLGDFQEESQPKCALCRSQERAIPAKLFEHELAGYGYSVRPDGIAVRWGLFTRERCDNCGAWVEGVWSGPNKLCADCHIAGKGVVGR